VWRGAFFFLDPRVGLGTPANRSSCDAGCEGAGSFRRELKDEINSID
jgi:hypothetical protein